MNLKGWYIWLLTSLISVNVFAIDGTNPQFIPNKNQYSDNVIAKLPLNFGQLWFTKSGIWIQLLKEEELESLHDKTVDHSTLNCDVVHLDFFGANLSNYQFEGDSSEEIYNFIKGSNPQKWSTDIRKREIILFKNVYDGVDLEFKCTNSGIKYNWLIHDSKKINCLDQIKYQFEGANVQMVHSKKLKINSKNHEFFESIPLVYFIDEDGQKTVEQLHYRIDKNVISYHWGGTDAQSEGLNPEINSISNSDLVIDPILVFSTYSGSFADNFGCTGTYDDLGNGYSGGTVFDLGLPTSAGAIQLNFGGGEDENLGYGGSRDGAILKFNQSGSQLLYCTYLGGSGNEQPHSMVVDSLNNLFIMGSTTSLDFPMITSPKPYNHLPNTGYEFFVVKLNSTGNQLRGSTFVGGSKMDAVGADRSTQDVNDFPLLYNYADEFRGEIITDNKNVYIGGFTYSFDFPNTVESSPISGPKMSGVVFSLDGNLSNLRWSRLIYSADNSYTAIYGIALGDSGDIYATGGTNGKQFSNKYGAKWINNFIGDVDGIILRLTTNTGSLLSGRYYGTNSYDQSYFVQTDNSGRPYIFGHTEAPLPVINARYNDPNKGQFITRFNRYLNQVELQTTFGSNTNLPNISPSAFLIDRCERIFISGWGGATNSSLYDVFTGNPKTHRNKGSTRNLPITGDAYQRTTDGSDFYVAVFSKNMYNLAYATFFGGMTSGSKEAEEHVDGGTSRFDKKGIIYQSVCAGCRRNGIYPTTPNAYSRINNSSNCNNALFKIDFENLNKIPSMNDTLVEVIATQPINFTMWASDPDVFDTLRIKAKWLNRAGMAGSDTAIITTYEGINRARFNLTWNTQCSSFSKDTAVLQLMIFDCGCPEADTIFRLVKIVVKEPPVVNPPDAICVSYDRVNKEMKVAWPATTVPTAFFKYFLLEKIDPQGNVSIIDTIRSSNAGSFLDGNVVTPNLQNYCYKIIGVNICNVKTNPLNSWCTVRELNTPIDNVHMISASVFEDFRVDLLWESSKEPDFKEFEVYKYPRGAKPQYITPNFITTDTFLSDSAVKVDDYSYCYEIIVVDKCGHISKPSNEGCTVVINGNATEAPDYHFDLNWLDYKGWELGSSQWILERKYGGRPLFQPVYSGVPSIFTFRDADLDYDWGGYWYRVKGIEQVSLGKTNYNATTESNWIYLIQPPEVWVPDAFTVNQDNLNDVWGTFPVFARQYSMKVYNRWGQKIWESSNKKTQWDGTVNGKPAPDGVYAWLLTFDGWNDKEYQKTGTVLILH
jgi:gliding motility-associated-like protein